MAIIDFNQGTWNTTNDGKDPALNPIYYDRDDLEILKLRKTDLAYIDVGSVRELPLHFGDKYTVIRHDPVSTFESSLLSKGDYNVPNPIQLTSNALEIEVLEYGHWGMIQDWVDTNQFINYTDKLDETLMSAALETKNVLNKEILFNEGSVFIEGHAGSVSVDDLTADDTLSVTSIHTLANEMDNNTVLVPDSNKSNDADYLDESTWVEHPAPIKGFGAYGERYKAFITGDIFRNILETSDDAAKLLFAGITSKYGEDNIWVSGKMYPFFNVMFYICHGSQIVTGTNTDGITYKQILLLASGATTTSNDVMIQVSNDKGMQRIYHPKESGGTSSPLNRYATLGVRFRHGAALSLPAGAIIYTFADADQTGTGGGGSLPNDPTATISGLTTTNATGAAATDGSVTFDVAISDFTDTGSATLGGGSADPISLNDGANTGLSFTDLGVGNYTIKILDGTDEIESQAFSIDADEEVPAEPTATISNIVTTDTTGAATVDGSVVFDVSISDFTGAGTATLEGEPVTPLTLSDGANTGLTFTGLDIGSYTIKVLDDSTEISEDTFSIADGSVL